MADRVLIIDDDEQLVDAYRDYLSESGYEVDCAQELEDRLKANGQLMRIENGFENGLPHAPPPANCTTVFPSSFNRIGFRRNTSAPDAAASALSSGQP